MSFRLPGLALLFVVLGLQGCGGSSADDPSDPAAVLDDDDAQLSADGEGLQPGDGVSPPQINQLGEDPVPSVGPAGDSGVTVNGKRYPLDSALGDIWGVSADHFNVNFTLSNGKYLLETVEIEGSEYSMLIPVETSAVVHAEMYSPGEQFSLVTYSYSPFGDGDGVLAGNAFFDNAWVGVDEDLSGDVEHDERQNVVGGSIEFIGTLPYIEMLLSVTLEDGQLVEGHYTGLFDFTNR